MLQSLKMEKTSTEVVDGNACEVVASNQSSIQELEYYSRIGKPSRHALIVCDSNTIRIFPLEKEKLTIGRHNSNDIVLQYKGVSRHHAVIQAIGETCWIADGNEQGKPSMNGLAINGVVRKSQQLQDGDLIVICRGVYSLFVKLEDGDRSPLGYKNFKKFLLACMHQEQLSDLPAKVLSQTISPEFVVCLDEIGTILSFKEALDIQDLSLFRLFKHNIGRPIDHVLASADEYKVIKAIQDIKSMKPVDARQIGDILGGLFVRNICTHTQATVF
ncbi:FHA domain-containing protein [Leptolyngbya sp. KIOST-1]|uniref:FHA domain-containing protein n=1 Tax=Leptolyngbya sp. KIOST-1 TaxID=1229172 RepID=UPI000565A72F|nr:FHA domain-containing protein [Leptolyngbya sp. KIOST-1]